MNEENIIKKWLNDELSPQEKTNFEQSQDAGFYEAIIKGASKFKAPITTRMPNFKIFEDEKLSNVPQKNNLQPWLRWVTGMAAAVVLTFGIYTWLSNTPTTIETSIAQTEQITLPDTSEIRLNAMSQISFHTNSWNEKRLVNLRGEAFFDVAKGGRFDVQTNEGTISVLGTEFNVRQRGGVLDVTCFEGRVKVVSGTISEIITVGEQISIRDGQLVRSTTEANRPSWQDKISRFKSAPLAEVIEELERHYEVDVIAKNIDITKLFTGAFEHTDLKTALQSITRPFGIQYEVKNNGKEIILNTQ